MKGLTMTLRRLPTCSTPRMPKAALARLMCLASIVVMSALVDASPALAQSVNGSLRGYVKDEQGGALPGVTVTASGPALLAPVIAVTESAGLYRLNNFPPATYASQPA